MSSYESIRRKYKPDHVKVLLIAESPPPPPEVQSSRQFYYTERIRRDDRLFTNTIKALYTEATNLEEPGLEKRKEFWLKRFQSDGWYMIESLEESLPHEVTKKRRQELIRQNLPSLIKKVKALADKDTRIILIKSNVYEVAAEPLRQAGLNVINNQLVDYPGHFNQQAYRQKLAKLARRNNG